MRAEAFDVAENRAYPEDVTFDLEANMNHLLLLQTIALLGLRLRYWAIIVVVIIVVLALGFMMRNRAA